MSHDLPHSDTEPHLTPADIQEFKKLIHETTGIVLSDEEAWSRATELVALYRMFLGPLPEDPEGRLAQEEHRPEKDE